MRVAHVLRKYDPSAWGGTESAVLELLTGLRQHGVESVVYAPSLASPKDGPDPFVDSGFTVKRFSAFLPTVGISKAERERSLSVGGNIMSWTAPSMLFFDRDVDLIHSHALGRIGGIAKSVARLRGLPFVVTIHGGYLDLADNVRSDLAASTRHGIEYGKLFGWMVGARTVVEDADSIITCNPREAELLVKKLPARRVERMPHGIPTQVYGEDHRAEAEAFLPALHGKTVLLSVGRIDAVKNQAFLVERMPEVLAKHPDAVLVLVGPITDAGHGQHVRDRIAALGLGDQVIMTGGLAPRDPRLLGLYQRADIMVLPSLSETFGLVILEAWSAGTPVIATRTSGASQVIDEGRNGRFFDLKDPSTFHDALNATLGNPDETRIMVERGRDLAQREYDTRAVAARFKTLYEEVSARHVK